MEWTQDNLTELTKMAISAIVDATSDIDGNRNVTSKAGLGNYVTQDDIDVETMLLDTLPKELDGQPISFFGEEGARRVNESELPYLAWVVDPIDGTSNMLHGLPYATSVALTAMDSKTQTAMDTLIGIVISHADGKAYVAIKDSGSYSMTLVKAVGRHAKHERTHNRVTKAFGDISFDAHQITVSQDDSLAICGNPYEYEKYGTRNTVTFDVMSRHFGDVKRIGPSSIDACKVADGTASAYVEYGLTPYDVDASRLIVTEANGVYEADDGMFVFASSQDVADRLKAYIHDEIEKMR